MEISVNGVETERDFYFGKLRDIEVLCQQNEGLPVVEEIMKIMYKTEVSVHKYMYTADDTIVTITVMSCST